jgi:type I restriction enzyme, S subunit
MTDWDVVTLADVANLNPTRPRVLGALSDTHRVTFVPMPAVNQHTGEIDGAQVRSFSEVKKGFTYFAEGDVIFAKITPCMQNGKSAVAVGLENGIGFGSTEFHVIRPNNERILAEWIWHFVRQPAFRAEGIRYLRGAVGQQRVPVDYLANARIPLPTLAEQRRIVAGIKECMERLDEIESLRASSKAQQRFLSASLIESELHPELTNDDEWSIHSVGELVTAVRNGRSIARDTEGRADGAVLTLTAVRSIDLGVEQQKPIALPDTVAQQFGIDQGDVFVSRANTIELVGLSAVAEEKPAARLIYPDLLIKLKADRSRILPRYLAYALRSASARKQIKARALGSSQTMVKISGERLREITVPVPSLDRQAQIIDRLDDAHELTRELVTESVSGEVEALRGAILRKAFAGEL